MTALNDTTGRIGYFLGDVIESEWTAEQRAAWSGLMDIPPGLRREHNRELEASHRLTLSMLGLLGRLASVADHVLGLSDLARATGLSLSRVSRVIDVLEGRKLVERVRCPGDARAVNAQLTDAGLDLARNAQATLRSAVRRDFLSALDETEVAVLASAFERLFAHAAPCESAEPDAAGAGLLAE
jgi:DNA-binding MarR family transcriptional regulator